ncbi:MAG: SRPBCC domain-containing protein [Breznakibacter sp.]|nr:SRPBCC domain-containing protein [Breznakibacter sp.]
MSIQKEKISLEYIFKTSPGILFSRLSTASGLSEWFADDVNIKENIYTFMWDKTEQTAELLQKKENKTIRFRWLNEEDDTPTDNEESDYFEFKITVLELTGETALIVTDSVLPEEREDTIELWNEQIEQLRTKLGSS